jgi:glycerol-3-phosphate acyltransferase PlsY
MFAFAWETSIAYLVGSFPTAYLVVKWRKGLDVRAVGSGNMGTLNAYRTIGFSWALLVLAVDTGKGMLAIVPALLHGGDLHLYGTSLGAVIGHNWPLFLGFRGGRGAATVFGISLAVMPILTGTSAAGALLAGWLLHNAVVGIVGGFLLLNLLTIVTGQSLVTVTLCLALTFLVGGTYFVGQRRQFARVWATRRWRDALAIE